MAEAFNVPVCPHFLMELHLPLCCAVPNSRWLEFIPQLDLVTKTGVKIENGEAVASSESGLGIDWDWFGLRQVRCPPPAAPPTVCVSCSVLSAGLMVLNVDMCLHIVYRNHPGRLDRSPK
jgi:hypothetical protein